MAFLNHHVVPLEPQFDNTKRNKKQRQQEMILGYVCISCIHAIWKQGFGKFICLFFHLSLL